MSSNETQSSSEEFTDRVIHINRVAKVVKGGRRFSFSALIVVGDGHGQVGVGLGKANEVPEAIRKGTERARKNMFKISLDGHTIPHVVHGHDGSGKVLLRPASPGTGVIAGGAVRAVVEAAGVKDILSKCIGSTNKLNVVNATIKALQQLEALSDVAGRRSKTNEEVRPAPQPKGRRRGPHEAEAQSRPAAQWHRPLRAPEQGAQGPRAQGPELRGHRGQHAVVPRHDQEDSSPRDSRGERCLSQTRRSRFSRGCVRPSAR
jgi:small subunit ribosomal protein S5